MKIQSAGQQKYQDLIRKPAERVRTAMIVWISLACLAFISFFSNVWVALILAAAAAVLAARNIGARRVLEGALDGIEDREDFFCQLMEGNTMEFPGYPVVVTREYLVTAYQTVLVYRLEEVKKTGREELKVTEFRSRRSSFLSAPAPRPTDFLLSSSIQKRYF